MKKRLIYPLFFFALAGLCLISCRKTGQETASRAKEKNIVETGELAAVNNRSFILPRFGQRWYEMRVIGLLEHGSIVHPGDSIIQLDPTEIKRFIIDWESSLETELANLEKLRVDQSNRLNDLNTNMKNQKASFNLKKIELESSRFETDRIKKIKELEFKQTQIELNKEEKKMELSRIIMANELKIQEIRVKQFQTYVANAYALLPALTFRSSTEGVFQIGINWRTDAMIKVGDNVYPGNNMANVPDLTWMKVNTCINENDFLKIHLEQAVAVRLDALPDVVFDGEISYIGKLCHLKDNNKKSREKIFDVEVKMLKSDLRLKPGMTVSCEYLND